MEENLKKNSIFMQRKMAKRYMPVIREIELDSNRIEYASTISHNIQLVAEEKILQCLLSMPPLELRDRFYIEDLNKLVIIENVARTSNDSIVYYVQDSIIEDELSAETYNKAADVIKYSKELYNETIKELNNKNDELAELRGFKYRIESKLWYKLFSWINR